MPSMPTIRETEAVLDQALVDMQTHLRAIRPQVAAAMADERRLVQRLEAEMAESHTWEGRAMRAVRAGDDGLAKAALIRKAESDRRVTELQAQHQGQRQAVERLKTSLRQLQEKAHQARRNREVLVARARRAQAQRQIQATIQGINGVSAFDVLARIDEQMDRIEAETEAQMELANEMSGADDQLVARFRLLEQQSLDDDLAALKARMALPAAAPAPRLAAPSPVDDELAALKARLALVPVSGGRVG